MISNLDLVQSNLTNDTDLIMITLGLEFEYGTIQNFHEKNLTTLDVINRNYSGYIT